MAPPTDTMVMLSIRKSTEKDIDCLLRLADQARHIMRESGNLHQWVNGYPSREVFLRDIANGNSYLVEQNGKVVATFAFIPSPEPTYQTIYEGEWKNADAPYHVVHRIASSGEQHGVLKVILNYCFLHCNDIRIDTHRNNVIMRHLLSKLRFTECGIIYLENGDERIAYQKTI